MDDRVEALRRALDEAQKIAGDGDAWHIEHAHVVNGEPYWDVDGPLGGWIAHVSERSDAEHIARWDPSTVLRLVQRDRELLERHKPVEVWAGWDHIPPGQPGARELLWLECSACWDADDEDDDPHRCPHSRCRWPCPEIDLAARFWIGEETPDGLGS